MGSSVFHGGFSTLLAVSMLGFARLYFFSVFFKTWFTMILFGMLNGMILQPILLSFFGPVNSLNKITVDEVTEDSLTKN